MYSFTAFGIILCSFYTIYSNIGILEDEKFSQNMICISLKLFSLCCYMHVVSMLVCVKMSLVKVEHFIRETPNKV